MIFEKIRELIENLDLGKTVSELLITTANIVLIAIICLVVCAVILIVTKIISARAKRKSLKTITKSAKDNHFTFYLCLFFIAVTVSSLLLSRETKEGS